MNLYIILINFNFNKYNMPKLNIKIIYNKLINILKKIMKGSYESKETLDFDKENSVIIKNSEFSQINIDLRNSSEDSKSAAPEIVKNDQTNPASQINPINPDENSHGENKQDPEIQVSKYETLDESYSDTFVQY